MSFIGTIRDAITGIVANVKANVNTTHNELLVNLEGHQCLANSTDVELGIGGVFTGSAWQDTLDYGMLSVNVCADQNSAVDGLDIQWSNDGINVIDHDKYTILANYTKTFTHGPAERYYRVVYTNGSVAQGSFCLTSLLRRCYVKPSSHSISRPIVGEDDAELVKAVVTGVRDDGIFGNAKLDNDDKLMVNSQPYLYTIAEGDISGHSSLLKFGTRSAIDANTQSTIWEGTTDRYVYLTSAEQLKVSSSATTDTTGGTGARTITLYGLDSAWHEINEVITMNGTSVVTTTASFIRVFRCVVTTCGINYTNDGNITITNNAGTVQLIYIPATDGQTLMAVWTVPDGKTAYLIQGTASTDSNKGARVSIYTRLNDGGTLYPWAIKYRAYLFSGNQIFPFNIPFVIPAKTDIEVRFLTPAAAGTTSGGATFELWYE